mmetsp:Transcript_59765/g.106241  ORF Transcript_59765/g.106241 Transcript_59765/m.106241 type:complete len:100 (+) Transcript_59765:37-336(+)
MYRLRGERAQEARARVAQQGRDECYEDSLADIEKLARLGCEHGSRQEPETARLLTVPPIAGAEDVSLDEESSDGSSEDAGGEESEHLPRLPLLPGMMRR